MKDRVPTPGQEGRVKITPESGGAAYYAKLEMADNPTQAGDEPIKANLLPDDVASALGLTGNPQVKDALMRTVELFVTAEMINRSSIAAVLVGYGITQTVSANYKIAHTTPTTFTLLGTKEFSLTGIGGFSRRLKITWAESPGGNADMFEVYYKIKLSDGTIYTTSAINPYNNGTKGIEIDIVQPEKNNLSATVDVYGRCANTSTGWEGDITLATLTLAADKMAYID